MTSKNEILFNKQYTEALDQWTLIRDFVKGNKAVKDKTTDYLPMPCAHIQTEANKKVYQQYLERAYVLNFTRRTKKSLLGNAFYQKPFTELDSSIEYLTENADGAGNSLLTIAKQATGEVIEVGRFGILTDFPSHEGNATKADDGILRPFFALYKAEAIADWSEDKHGAVKIVSAIKLVEEVCGFDNFGFETGEVAKVERILFINEEGYYQQKITGEDGQSEIKTPVDANGKPLRYIPFEFIGAENNNPEIGEMPLIDLAVVNLGHYRNSADDEQACYKIGQPTLVVSTSMNDDELEGAEIVFGSNNVVVLNETDSAQLIQPDANTMARDRMDKKLEEAKSIGASLYSDGGKQETAEAVRIQKGSEVSALSTITENVSIAMTLSLDHAEDFMNKTPSYESKFEMSGEFFFTGMDAQQRAAWAADVMTGVLPVTDYYNALRESKLIPSTRTDEDIADDLANAAPSIDFSVDDNEEVEVKEEVDIKEEE